MLYKMMFKLCRFFCPPVYMLQNWNMTEDIGVSLSLSFDSRAAEIHFTKQTYTTNTHFLIHTLTHPHTHTHSHDALPQHTHKLKHKSNLIKINVCIFCFSLHTFLCLMMLHPRLVSSTKNNININTINKQKKGHGQHGGTVSGAANLRWRNNI